MKLKRLGMFILFTTILFSGCQSNIDLGEPLNEDVVKSGPNSMVSREQSLYFNCLATDGLAAYSLMQLIYDQPEITENVMIEYTLYSEAYLTKTDIDKKKDNFAVLPFELAIETLLRHDTYKLVGVVKTNGESEYKLALLITNDIIELHPEFAEKFVSMYLESCNWVTANPERALAYATQLNIVESLEQPEIAESVTYYNASRSVKAVGTFLLGLGYTEDQVKRIEAQTIDSNE